MTKITKTYNINSIQQLIDLNQDSKNFKLTFDCKSHNVNDKYEILVLSQSQLDTEDANNLPFKQVSHTISGNIKADQDIYQNYFMAIRSDKNCKVDIILNKEEIEPNITQQSPPILNDSPPKVPKKKKKSFLRSSLFLWIVISIIAGVLLYFIFFTKTDALKDSKQIVHSVHGGSVHGGSVHGGSVHGGSVHGGSVHGGSVHSGSVHGGHNVIQKRKQKKKFSFKDFHM